MANLETEGILEEAEKIPDSKKKVVGNTTVEPFTRIQNLLGIESPTKAEKVLIAFMQKYSSDGKVYLYSNDNSTMIFAEIIWDYNFSLKLQKKENGELVVNY